NRRSGWLCGGLTNPSRSVPTVETVTGPDLGDHATRALGSTGRRVGVRKERIEMANERRSVLRRALRILDTIKDAGEGLSLSEISRRSGVPLSTTHRIVGELHEWGALERDESGEYRIGLRLWEIAAATP